MLLSYVLCSTLIHYFVLYFTVLVGRCFVYKVITLIPFSETSHNLIISCWEVISLSCWLLVSLFVLDRLDRNFLEVTALRHERVYWIFKWFGFSSQEFVSFCNVFNMLKVLSVNALELTFVEFLGTKRHVLRRVIENRNNDINMVEVSFWECFLIFTFV